LNKEVKAPYDHDCDSNQPPNDLWYSKKQIHSLPKNNQKQVEKREKGID
jgi:hypothetical protein